MRVYLISLVVGLLVGMIYGLLGVRSPAPPVVALLGLLGILLGERLVPIAKRVLGSRPVAPFVRSTSLPEVLGPHAAPPVRDKSAK